MFENAYLQNKLEILGNVFIDSSIQKKGPIINSRTYTTRDD